MKRAAFLFALIVILSLPNASSAADGKKAATSAAQSALSEPVSMADLMAAEARPAKSAPPAAAKAAPAAKPAPAVEQAPAAKSAPVVAKTAPVVRTPKKTVFNALSEYFSMFDRPFRRAGNKQGFCNATADWLRNIDKE